MICSLAYSSSKFSSRFLTKAWEPDLAMVPKFSMISSLLIPTPVSKRVIVLSFELVLMLMDKSSAPASGLSWPLVKANLYFSRASEQLDSNSLMNTSLSV